MTPEDAYLLSVLVTCLIWVVAILASVCVLLFSAWRRAKRELRRTSKAIALAHQGQMERLRRIQSGINSLYTALGVKPPEIPWLLEQSASIASPEGFVYPARDG